MKETLALLALSATAQTAAHLPQPEVVNDVMSAITQIAILIIGLINYIKKNKKQPL